MEPPVSEKRSSKIITLRKLNKWEPNPALSKEGCLPQEMSEEVRHLGDCYFDSF